MKKIAEGRNAEVFEYKNDKVIKLLKPNRELLVPEDEFTNLTKLNSLGLPIPKIYGRITVNNRPGIILERIQGITLKRYLLQKPWKSLQIGQRIAELHYEIHKTKINGIPSQRENLIYWISKSQFEQAKIDIILKKLETLPDGDALCHGDFHFDNIVITSTGCVVLDWHDTSSGNPLADVAKTCILVVMNRKGNMSFMRLLTLPLRQLFNSLYTRTYLQLSGNSMEELKSWKLPVAAALMGRLDFRNTPSKSIRKMVDQLLSEERNF